MNNNKQTAVEWLFDNLKSHFEHDGDLLEVVQMSFEQAKAMEKEQIVDAVNDSWNMAKHSNFADAQAEQYYNEIYGK
jgi:hypothetical protein